MLLLSLSLFKRHSIFFFSYTTDKISPQVASCPDSKTVLTSTKTKRVFWSEPKFTDNKGVVSVSRSHASGQLFECGDTVVTYIAKDSFNNVAECTFRIYVTRNEIFVSYYVIFIFLTSGVVYIRDISEQDIRPLSHCFQVALRLKISQHAVVPLD